VPHKPKGLNHCAASVCACLYLGIACLQALAKMKRKPGVLEPDENAQERKKAKKSKREKKSKKEKKRRRADGEDEEEVESERRMKHRKESKRERRERHKREDEARDQEAQGMSWGRSDHPDSREGEIENGERNTSEKKEKEKANFGLSGALNKDGRTGKMYKGIVLKWSEPPDAVTPQEPGWRLYKFNADDVANMLPIHMQSAFLIGSEEKIADILIRDDSVEEQHAVIQFRIKRLHPPAGSLDPVRLFITPYIMDLETQAGTFLNDEKIEAARYYELKEKDQIRFGNSPDFVLLYAEAS